MPQAASHIDEKIISLLHRWLVKKNNPNLSKKLERKWAPSRELIKGFFVSFLSWESHRNKFWLRLRGGEPPLPLLPLSHCPSLPSPLTLCHGAKGALWWKTLALGALSPCFCLLSPPTSKVQSTLHLFSFINFAILPERETLAFSVSHQLQENKSCLPQALKQDFTGQRGFLGIINCHRCRIEFSCSNVRGHSESGRC